MASQDPIPDSQELASSCPETHEIDVNSPRHETISVTYLANTKQLAPAMFKSGQELANVLHSLWTN
jgi:hypothetical protein